MNTKRRLLVSIHDVTPYHLHRLEQLVPLVEEIVGKGRFALLVVPNFHHAGRLDGNAAFAKRLRGWADDGCDIFLHGFAHLDELTHSSFWARLKAQLLTSGEGEFFGLSYYEASRKLVDGRKMVEDIIARPVTGFIGPAWLYSQDSLAAIAHQGFTLCEDHFRVWNPQNDVVLARGPVVTYASRTPTRLLSSVLWSRIATLALLRAETVRFAVHPHDVDAPELVSEIRRALRAFGRSHSPSSYRALQPT